MKKVYTFLILFVAITFLTSCKESKVNTTTNSKSVFTEKEIELIWKHGIAFQGDKALYLDPDKMEGENIVISEASIKSTKGKRIKGSTLLWVEGNELYIYDSEKDDPYFRLPDTKRVLKYKIDGNKLMLSEDGNTWDLLEVKLIQEFEPPKETEQGEPIFMIIRLKSKWFDNKYELVGTPG